MMSVGSVLSTIEQASHRVRQDEAQLGQVIEAATAEMTRLRAEQAELYRRLAHIRMDALQNDQILRTLDKAEQKAQAAIDKQRESLARLADEQQALERDLAAATSRRLELSDAISQAVDAITAQEQTTEARLADDVAWQALNARVDGLEDRAEAAEAKAQQSEADRDEKSKPYLADPLFIYLWERGYGTSAYRAGTFTRMGDSFVARVVQYEQARQNYYALTEIPKRLRDHAERLKADLAAADAELETFERAALEADGIKPLEARHEQAVAALDAHDKHIAELETRMSGVEQERRTLTDLTGNHGIGAALQELAASLQRDDLRVLLREAMETPTPEDEQIVARLQEIVPRLEQLGEQADEARQTLLELTRRRSELERSSQDFRRTGYERGGGTFLNDKLIGDVIGGIIGGVLSSRELRDALRSGYRPAPRPRGRSRSSGPSFGGSRGGFRTGGGSRSGGFRTGGGF